MSEHQRHGRPPPLQPPMTPPSSPTSKKSPPEDPLLLGQAEASSKSRPRSDSVLSWCTPSTQMRPKLSATTGSDAILEFCADDVDYVVMKDAPLGAGRFSNVYLARPRVIAHGPAANLTPPVTPTKSTWSSSSQTVTPPVYAVKLAIDKPSLKVLHTEARILTHLCRDRGSQKYMVPFHGFDAGRNALVMSALPRTLADVIELEFSSLETAAYADTMASILPHVGHEMTAGLSWMHSQGVIHSDIKPLNILLRPDMPMPIPFEEGQRILDVPFTPVFADFTSSFIVSNDPSTISTAGGGTYDYMPPEQLSAPFPRPDSKTDVYALAITLLEFVTGRRPFQDADNNRHMKMAMIKEGKVLDWAMRNYMSEKRFIAVATILLKSGVDIKILLQCGLAKKPGERLNAEDWSRLW